MLQQELTKLSDLFRQDLAGWQITEAHFLELEHGLMGTFPAITAKDGLVVATINKSMLRKVWNRLPRRQAKVTSILVLANPTTGIAFHMSNFHGGDTQPLHILSDENIIVLCSKSSQVRWAGGLIGGREGPVKEPRFD